jgi:hypothetical protein
MSTVAVAASINILEEPASLDLAVSPAEMWPTAPQPLPSP